MFTPDERFVQDGCTNVQSVEVALIERELMQYRVAAMHYRDGLTMDAVARQLGVSRSTVSRLLADARRAGIVRISVSEPVWRNADVALLEEEFGVSVVSVPVAAGASETEVLEAVARAAAQEFTLWVREAGQGPVVGLAWGRTVSALVSNLEPVDCRAVVVQMNGAVNSTSAGIPYAGEILAGAARAWRGAVLQFPVPAFFDFSETKNAMWRERSVQFVLDAQDNIDIAVFGVGVLAAGTQSHVYAGGYLTEADVRELAAERVVGDVNTVMLRADGSADGVGLNARASGMSPKRIARIPRRLCVAADRSRAEALTAALRAGVVTTLVADSALVASVARVID